VVGRSEVVCSRGRLRLTFWTQSKHTRQWSKHTGHSMAAHSIFHHERERETESVKLASWRLVHLDTGETSPLVH